MDQADQSFTSETSDENCSVSGRSKKNVIIKLQTDLIQQFQENARLQKIIRDLEARGGKSRKSKVTQETQTDDLFVHQERVKQLEYKIVEMNTEYVKMRDENRALQYKISLLQSKPDAAQAVPIDLQEQLLSQSDLIKEQFEQNEQLTQEVQELQARIKQLENSMSQASMTLAARDTSISTLRAENLQLNQIHSKVLESVAFYENEFPRLQILLDDRELVIKQKEFQVQQLDELVQGLRDDLSSQCQGFMEQQDRTNELQQQLDQYLSGVREFEQTYNEKMVIIQDLESQLIQSQEERVSFEGLLRERDDQIQLREAVIEKLQVQIEHHEHQIKQMQSNQATQQLLMKEYTSENQQLSEQLADRVQQLAALELSLVEQQGTVSATVLECNVQRHDMALKEQRLLERIKQLEAENAQLSQDYLDRNATMLAVDEERNHLLRLVDDYKEELSSQLMKYELMQEDNTTLTKSIEQLQNAQSTAKPSTSNTFTQTPTSSKSSAYTQTDPSEQISPLEIKRLNHEIVTLRSLHHDALQNYYFYQAEAKSLKDKLDRLSNPSIVKPDIGEPLKPIIGELKVVEQLPIESPRKQPQAKGKPVQAPQTVTRPAQVQAPAPSQRAAIKAPNPQPPPIAQSNQEFETLRSETTKLKKEIEILRHEMDASAAEKTALQSQLVACQQAQQASQQTHQEIHAKLIEMQQSDMATQLNNTMLELQKCQAQLADSGEQMKKLRNELNAKQSECLMLKNVNTFLHKDLEKYRD